MGKWTRERRVRQVCLRQLVMGSALAALGCGSEPVAPNPGTQSEIVFQAEPEQDQNTEIYSVNADGTGLQRLTSRPGQDFAPSWSSDGSQIYFSSTGRDGEGTSVYAMDPDGDNVRLLLALPPGDALSPDGQRRAFAMDTPGDTVVQLELYISQADGTGAKLIAGLPGNLCDEAFFDCEDVRSIAWAPDGRQLAFSTVQFGRGASVTTRLSIVRDDGTGLQSLWTGFGPSWSPDGRRIAFASTNAPPTGIVVPIHLQFLEEVDGKWDALTVVVDGSLDQTQNFGPSWSPDGKAIAFMRGPISTPDSKIFVVNADGSGLRLLTDLPGAGLPKWRPRAP